jgi:hypothetical protein
VGVTSIDHGCRRQFNNSETQSIEACIPLCSIEIYSYRSREFVRSIGIRTAFAVCILSLPMTRRRERILVLVMFACLLRQAEANKGTFDFNNASRNRFKGINELRSMLSIHCQDVLLYIQRSSMYRLTAGMLRHEPVNNSDRFDHSLKNVQRQRFLLFGDDVPTEAPSSIISGNSDSPSRAPSLQPNASSGDIPTESDMASSPPSESPIELSPASNELSKFPSLSPSTPTPDTSLQPSPAAIPSLPSNTPSRTKVYTVFPTGDYSNDKSPNDADIFPKPTVMPKPSSSESSYSSTENNGKSLSGGAIFGVILIAGILLLMMGYTFVMRGRRQKNYRGSYHRSAGNGMRDLELTRWQHGDDDDGLL